MCLAGLITWPLPQSLRTHLLGAVSGDLGVYLWNLWIFRHELVEHHRLPFSTDHVFAYTDGADFSLHNYTPLIDILALPLVGPVGLVGAFNLLLLATIVVTALSTFGLCRRLGMARWSAWCAGALFVASPVMVARQTAHASLVAAAALPLFLWALLRALESRRRSAGALVGAVVAAATYSDAYYGIYCILMGTCVLAWRFLRAESASQPALHAHARWRRSLDVVTAAALAAIGWRVLTGQTSLALAGLHLSFASLYNPVLAFTAAILLRAWLTWRPWFRVVDRAAARALLPAGFVACATCLCLLLPPILGVALRFADGMLPNTETYWRSSPQGVDLLAFFVPNPNHPLWGRWTHATLLPDAPDAFPEFVAAFSWIGVSLIAVASVRRKLPLFWVVFTLFFAWLSLGPFLHVGGQNTYVIGPWALLRYVPVIGMARSPARFAIVAILGASILSGFAIEWWVRQRSSPRLAAAMLVMVLAFELLPAPRVLHSASIPEVYGLIATAADSSARVLQLPTGIRDGTSSIGDFSAETLYFQTRHGRPIIGGYLSRVAEARKRRSARLPMLRALNALSEPGLVPPPEWLEAGRAAGSRFLARACIGFVVVDKRRATRALRVFAAEALHLQPVHEDESYELLVPINPPPCLSDQSRLVP